MDASQPTTPPDAMPFALAAVGVLLASISFGFVPYFSRGLTDQGLAPYAVAFYRFILPAILLLPALVKHRRHWREILWGLGAGAVMGLGWIGYVSALQTVPASTVGVLYMTYPVFTILIAWALFADRPTRRGLVAAGLIVLAALIAGSPGAVPPAQIPTLLLALAAPFGFGLGISVLVHRLARIPPLARMASISLGSVIGLAPLILSAPPGAVLPADAHGWMLILGIGLVTAFVPQLLYTVCSPIIGATRSAVIGSIELPTMFAVGVLTLGEVITGAQAVACALVLAAIALTQSRATRNVTTVLSKTPTSQPSPPPKP